jgi:uncharacterized membrane protein YbaN (DUF454 family)
VNSGEAKDILLLYRPRSEESEAPEYAEALELAKRDPELAAWFRQHQLFQDAVSSGFDHIAVPEGLKEQILSERRAQTAPRIARKAVFLAMAVALVLLLLAISQFYPPSRPDNNFAKFRSRMTGDVQRLYPRMDLETNDLREIHAYLAKQGRGDYTLPSGLEKTAGTGCAMLHWHGKTVSMLCFNSGRTPSPATPDLFLFVVDRAAVKNPPTDASLQLSRVNGLITASWSSGSKTYVLAGSGDEAALRKYF